MTTGTIPAHQHIAKCEADSHLGRQNLAKRFERVPPLDAGVVPQLSGLGDQPQHGLNLGDANGFGSTHRECSREHLEISKFGTRNKRQTAIFAAWAFNPGDLSVLRSESVSVSIPGLPRDINDCNGEVYVVHPAFGTHPQQTPLRMLW